MPKNIYIKLKNKSIKKEEQISILDKLLCKINKNIKN